MQERNRGQNTKVTLETISEIPLVQKGDDLNKILEHALENTSLQDGDILVIAQKIISKAEGRIVNLQKYTPSKEALEIGQKSGRDPRLVELIIQESRWVNWVMGGTPESPGIVVVKHRLGHVCSNAGIDQTNTGSKNQDFVLLLPEDPDKSAKKIADYFKEAHRVKIGVVVIDTLGDRHRHGCIGKAIGVANVPARFIERDFTDLDGKQAQSDLAFADGVAGLAMIMMGRSDKSSPVVLVRGVEYPFSPTTKIKDVLL